MTRLGWISAILFVLQAAFFGISISDFNRFAGSDRYAIDTCNQRWGSNSTTPDETARLNCLGEIGRNHTANQTKALYCWIGLALGSALTLAGVWKGWRDA